ncbi:MAG: DnaJ domain-containing protein [Methanosarcinales archaeon]|nr:DnaJ domain-containing protein [Methanosarcinales archaeon]
MRSQRIREWVVAFAEHPTDEETKLQLLQEFINCLTPEGSSLRNLIKETDAFSDRKRDIGSVEDDPRPYYYQLLDVSTDASQDEIKEAYRRLSMLYHPDKSADLDADEKMKKINESYSVLSDPDKRARYDNFENSFNG